MFELVNLTVILTNSFVTVKIPKLHAASIMEKWAANKESAKKASNVLRLMEYMETGQEQCMAACVSYSEVIAMYTHEINTSRTEVMNEQIRLLREVKSALAAAD